MLAPLVVCASAPAFAPAPTPIPAFGQIIYLCPFHESSWWRVATIDNCATGRKCLVTYYIVSVQEVPNLCKKDATMLIWGRYTSSVQGIAIMTRHHTYFAPTKLNIKA